MRFTRWLIIPLAALLAMGTWGLSQATKPAPPAAARVKKEVKPVPKRYNLGQPWSKLTMLTDEQKAQIDQIRRATDAARKALNDREREDILGLLTDEQKAEYQTVLAADEAARQRKPATTQAAPAAKPAEAK